MHPQVRNRSAERRAVSIVVLFLLFPFAAGAIEFRGLGGRPANPDHAVPYSDTWFLYTLAPGEVKEDAVIVQNATEEAQQVLVYPADTTPSSDGGFALKQRVETMTEVGSWIRLYPTSAPTTTDAILSALFATTTPEAVSSMARCAWVAEGDARTPEGEAALIENFRQESQLHAKEYLRQLREWCAGVREVPLTLAPGDAVTVPFTIAIPQGADVGEHAGALMIEKAAGGAREGGQGGVLISTRVGVRVYETVPGAVVRTLALGSLDVRLQREKNLYIASVRIMNEGNVSQDADVTLFIQDKIFDRRDAALARQVQVLRGSEMVTNFEWPRPKYGFYTFHAKVEYRSGEEIQTLVSPEVSVWIIPWIELGIAFAILLALIAALTAWRIQRRRLLAHEGWKRSTAKRGDTIVDVAARTNVSWQKIAAVNKLKKPYALAREQVILLPPLPKRARKRAKKRTPHSRARTT